MKIRDFIEEKWRSLTTTQIIVLFFLLVILIGALLLNLPIASRDRHSSGFFHALFTATSATCVAGFSLRDIWTQWSMFGQVVILIMIEIGGLGFMSTVIFFILLANKRIGMRQRMAMAQGLGIDVGGVVRIERWVIRNSLIVQGIGAVLLTLGFLPHYDWKQSIWLGLSHSISAFCNCGLDFMGFSGPGIGFTNHITEPLIMIPMMLLIVYGGLGFIVLEQIYRLKSFQKLNAYAKIVLIATAVLIVVGWIAYLAIEWNNPNTLGPMNIPQKIMAALFQSVNTRTAGFAGIDQNGMHEISKTLTCVLMIIGGAASSTSGGIKVVTLAVLGLYTWARMRGKRTVIIYNRAISNSQILDAVTIAGLMAGMAIVGGVFISVNSRINIGPAVFSSISAIATCGLSIAETAALRLPSKILLMVFMFFGRVGVLSISLSFMIADPAEERIQRAETKLIIG
ncbi:MAG: hypothetical protein IJI14_10075 [Anaerolineaceae bacterium]|nr:hypothetical protein [Anaerolineaceae bacterium]